MKQIGSAVFTALQAKSKTIEEVAEMSKKRRVQAVCAGKTTAEWDDSFWNTIGLMEAERINAVMSR